MRTTEVSELNRDLDHEGWFPHLRKQTYVWKGSLVIEDSFCPVAYDGARF